MDDLVKAALAKWPNVPHCFDWLGLDARGRWWMRDERTQAAGPFPAHKGSRIEHDKLVDFIQRNYEADEAGCWFFQNGPQRVYVELEAAPHVWLLDRDAAAGTEAGAINVHSHTGQPARCDSAWLDAQDRLFLNTDIGFGLVHSLDMGLAADAVAAGVWSPQRLPFAELVERFGYVPSPAARRARHAASERHPS